MASFKLAGKWKDAIDNLESSFQKTEEFLQDQEVRSANQKLIEQGYPVNLDDPVTFYLNENTGEMEPRYVPKFKFPNQDNNTPLATKQKLFSLLGPNYPTPITNEWLGNKTAEQYIKDRDIEKAGFPFPGLNKVVGKRLYKIGEQFVDNVPGLSSLGTNPITGEADQFNNLAGSAIQAGGRILPVLGAAWYGVNAGPAKAMTLDDARRLGYLK